MKKLKGVGASNGVAVGSAYVVKEIVIIASTKAPGPAPVELKHYAESIAKTSQQLAEIQKIAKRAVGEKNAEIFVVHSQLANDAAIVDEVKDEIEHKGYSAEQAVQDIYEKQRAAMAALDDPYFKERAADLVDVSRRLLANLKGITLPDLSAIKKPSIVVATDLTPSQTVMLDPKLVKGIITKVGGRTSHAAIIARSLEIPAVMGIGSDLDIVKNDDLIAVSGSTGEVIVDPDKQTVEAYEHEIEKEARIRRELQKFINLPSVTKDGHAVRLEANIGSPNDMDAAIKNGAEGIGLFRSEFLYMESANWPDEQEQFDRYKEVVSKTKGEVVIRTLDIGGDKTLPYFQFPKEDNPFLGYRAIRLCLDKVDIFKTQLRALLRASAFGNLLIMFPMIAVIEEFTRAKEIYQECVAELKKEGVEMGNPQVGMMIEVPSAAANAVAFAKHADFFSIGTNDLIQYSMAADRMASSVQYLYQPLNPGLLRLVKMTIDGAHGNKRWAAMCGEMAGDPDAIAILVGLGLDNFSMSASSILPARRIVSMINLSDAHKLANAALACGEESEVKKLVDAFNKQHGI